MRRHVVLPQPEGPTTATNSFSRTSKLTLSTAAISLPSRRNSRVTPSNTILLILPSPGRKPAVDENRLAGYVVRCRAGKEHRRTPQIAQFAVATDKRARSHLLPALRIACDGRGQRGSENPGAIALAFTPCRDHASACARVSCMLALFEAPAGAAVAN